MALSTAQARLLELKALGLTRSATAAEITTAIGKKYGATAPTFDPKTGLPYTQATARAAGSGQLGPQIIGGALLGGVVGGIFDSVGTAVRGALSAGAADTAAADAGGGAAAGGAADTGGGAAAGGAGGAGGIAAGAAAAGLGATGAITDAVSFLQWIAWIFHPVNILRAVEFLTGLGLIAFGVHAELQAYQEATGRSVGGARDILRRSGIGRAASATPVGRAAEGARQVRRGRQQVRHERTQRRQNDQYRSGQRRERKRQNERSTSQQRRKLRRAGGDVPF